MRQAHHSGHRRLLRGWVMGLSYPHHGRSCSHRTCCLQTNRQKRRTRRSVFMNLNPQCRCRRRGRSYVNMWGGLRGGPSSLGPQTLQRAVSTLSVAHPQSARKGASCLDPLSWPVTSDLQLALVHGPRGLCPVRGDSGCCLQCFLLLNREPEPGTKVSSG